MLNEILNAMMLAELLYDRTVISLGRTPRRFTG
jgi:hypothetical protein